MWSLFVLGRSCEILEWDWGLYIGRQEEGGVLRGRAHGEGGEAYEGKYRESRGKVKIKRLSGRRGTKWGPQHVDMASNEAGMWG